MSLGDEGLGQMFVDTEQNCVIFLHEIVVRLGLIMVYFNSMPLAKSRLSYLLLLILKKT